MSRTPATIVIAAAQEWLEIADDLAPVAPLVAAVANRLPGPPVWLMIVAPPSEGKTELIRPVGLLPGVHYLSQVTDKTLASGKKRESNDPKHLSLLERLRAEAKFLLVIKDFGTILSLPTKMRNLLLAQLREVYDGAYRATYGTGIEVDWTGKLGILAGATPAVDRLHKLNSELGERFVKFRPRPARPKDVALLAAFGAENESARRAALDAAYLESFQVAQAQLASSVPTPEGGLVSAQAAQFVAAARTPVYHPGGSFDTSYEVGHSEGPGRVARVFSQLHHAAVIVYGGNMEAATRLVARVALDSVPGSRRAAMCVLAGCQDGVTVSAVAGTLRCDENTAKRVLDDLVILGLAEGEKPVSKLVYRPSGLLREYAALIFLDAYEPEEALQKLFGLPSNITPAGEREKVGV